MSKRHTILGFDFESYYDSDYSLTKIDPPSYILDPRWETIGCSFKLDEAPAFFVDGPDIPKFVATLDPDTTTTYAFNALFDNCILAWRYGFLPARMVCTMRLAVALRGHQLQGNSLGSVAKLLGVGVKGTTIESARGKHRADLIADPGLWRAYQAYANNDNELSHDILYRLLPELPSSERRVMDRVLRCAVDPQFVVDTNMLREHLTDLAAEKVTMLRLAAGMPTIDPAQETMNLGDDEVLTNALEAFAKNVRSNAKFEALLKEHGVDIEYKPSTTDPDRKIPAFAKTDDFMAGLQEHEDPIVQALACARLGLRSTIEESRGTRILNIAELPWENYRGGNKNLLPIPMKYCGAHTHRLSGDWLYNMQNLPAGRGANKSKLRKALKASPGYKVVVADKSQIECRINGWLCGQRDLLDIFRANGDPYSVLASSIFEIKVDKNIHKTERFIGKSGVLGLGFGCGDAKFYNMVVRSARVLGMDVKKLLTVWTPELALKSVRTYRALNGNIVQAWKVLQNILDTSWLGIGPPVRFGPCMIGHGYVEGPNGLKMVYGNPRKDPDTGDLLFNYGRRVHRMYGPKFLENIVQFLARINTMNDALRISDRGFRFVLQSHDELAWIVPDAQVDECKRVALEEMRRPPSWAKDLPLNAECSHGQSYGDAK